jgi:hypothetical protein
MVVKGTKGAVAMGKKVAVLLGVAVVLVSPSIVFSDCVDLGRATSWYVQGAHSIIFYGGLMPIARVDVPYCALNPSSSIRLLKSYVCDGDKIIIDGSGCLIMSVSSNSFGSY